MKLKLTRGKDFREPVALIDGEELMVTTNKGNAILKKDGTFQLNGSGSIESCLNWRPKATSVYPGDTVEITF